MSHLIRTTMRPFDAPFVVSDAEYASLLSQGLVYGVAAPGPQDPSDGEVAAYVNEPGSAVTQALRATLGRPQYVRGVASSWTGRLRTDERIKPMAGSLTAYAGVATTSGSATVTMTSTSGLAVGQPFICRGLPYTTKITAIGSGTSITVSQNAGQTNTGLTALVHQLPLMAAPPTLTTQASRWFAAGAGVQSVAPNSGLQLVTGGPLGSFFNASSDYYAASPLNIAGNRGANNTPTVVAFDFDGDVFEFGYLGSGGGNSPGVRVWINEQAVTSDLFVSNAISSSSPVWCKVDFGKRVLVRVVIECASAITANSWTSIMSLATPTRNQILPPSMVTSRVAHIGDSHGQSAAAADFSLGFAFLYPRMLGLLDVFSSSVSGTGPATANGVAGTNFSDYDGRIADVIASGADVVVLQGSVNDVNAYPGNAATVASKFGGQIAALKAGLPNALIVATGPLFTNDPSANLTALAGIYKAQALAASVTYVDTMSPAWYSGTGTWNAPTGAGNADVYSWDQTHPIQPGHYYQARRMAAAIARVANGAA